jgi:hypothetical protein
MEMHEWEVFGINGNPRFRIGGYPCVFPTGSRMGTDYRRLAFAFLDRTGMSPERGFGSGAKQLLKTGLRELKHVDNSRVQIEFRLVESKLAAQDLRRTLRQLYSSLDSDCQRLDTLGPVSEHEPKNEDQKQ